MVSPQHASMKPCTSASCCSPSRLWKQIQTMISQDQREEFRNFLSPENDKIQHIINVLLTSRLSTFIKPKIDSRLIDKFGKSFSSATDLNAIEIALLTRHDHIAYQIIISLKKSCLVTEQQFNQFLNHQFQVGKDQVVFTALHLAAFWNMSKLVRLLLQEGAEPFIVKSTIQPIDCTTSKEVIALLKEYSKEEEKKKIKKQEIVPISAVTVPDNSNHRNNNSFLLKKAEEKSTSLLLRRRFTLNQQEVVVLPPPSPSPSPSPPPPIMSPLSFSSSSSSSSFSSLSSFEYYQWTPTALSPFEDNKEQVYLADEKEEEQVTIVQEEEQEETTTVTIVQEERTGCEPRIEQLQQEKKVRFDIKVILMDACIRGDYQEIIDNKVDFLNEIQDVQNRSLLHLAIMHGQEHLIEYLHDKVNINHVDNDGWTCLHYAAALGLWRSLEYLLSVSTSSMNARTKHGLKIQDCPESDYGKRKCKSRFLC